MPDAEFPMFTRLAADWHGGQNTQLYRVASTGRCTCLSVLYDEIGDAINYAINASPYNPDNVKALVNFENVVKGKM